MVPKNGDPQNMSHIVALAPNWFHDAPAVVAGDPFPLLPGRSRGSSFSVDHAREECPNPSSWPSRAGEIPAVTRERRAITQGREVSTFYR